MPHFIFLPLSSLVISTLLASQKELGGDLSIFFGEVCGLE